MKKQELVEVSFCHNNVQYTARVLRHSPTAIVLPDKTVLKTSTMVRTISTRRKSESIRRFRCIFNCEDELLPLDLLHRPGVSNTPSHIKFPIVFAQVET